jgi:hypothetical protein
VVESQKRPENERQQTEAESREETKQRKGKEFQIVIEKLRSVFYNKL